MLRDDDVEQLRLPGLAVIPFANQERLHNVHPTVLQDLREFIHLELVR